MKYFFTFEFNFVSFFILKIEAFIIFKLYLIVVFIKLKER